MLEVSLKQGNDVNTAILTAVITLFGGVIIFFLQRIIEQLYIKPINNYKDVIENIAIDLIKYAKFYANPQSLNLLPSDSTIRRDLEISSDRIRELSALLRVRTDNINSYAFWRKTNYIKVNKQDSYSAASKLMSLSNTFFVTGRGVENSDCADEIRALLNIATPN